MLLHTLASFFGLDQFFVKTIKDEVKVPAKEIKPSPLKYLQHGEGVRVHTRSGKYFFDFEPIISTRIKNCNAASQYLVRLDGVKAFKATVAGCYRKHHGITRKTGIAVLWARNALYCWDKEDSTYISRIICGIPRDPESVTMLRVSFLDRGDECAVDFHMVDWEDERDV